MTIVPAEILKTTPYETQFHGKTSWCMDFPAVGKAEHVEGKARMEMPRGICPVLRDEE